MAKNTSSLNFSLSLSRTQTQTQTQTLGKVASFIGRWVYLNEKEEDQRKTKILEKGSNQLQNLRYMYRYLRR